MATKWAVPHTHPKPNARLGLLASSNLKSGANVNQASQSKGEGGKDAAKPMPKSNAKAYLGL